MVPRDDPNVPAAPPPPVKVRTTFRPYEEIEVAAGEAAVLRHEGLIYDGPPVDEASFDPRNTPRDAPAADASAPAAKPGKTKETGQ